MLLQSEIEAIAKQVAIEIGKTDNKLLTVTDVSKLLGKSPTAVRKMCERDKLPHHNHYGSLYFSSVELKNYLLSL